MTGNGIRELVVGVGIQFFQTLKDVSETARSAYGQKIIAIVQVPQTFPSGRSKSSRVVRLKADAEISQLL